MKNEIGRVYREIIEEVARLVEEDSASIGLSMSQIHDLKVAWSRKLVEMTAVNQRGYDGYGHREAYGDNSRHCGGTYGGPGYHGSYSSGMTFSGNSLNFSGSAFGRESSGHRSPIYPSMREHSHSAANSPIRSPVLGNSRGPRNFETQKPNPLLHSPIMRSRENTHKSEINSFNNDHNVLPSFPNQDKQNTPIGNDYSVKPSQGDTLVQGNTQKSRPFSISENTPRSSSHISSVRFNTPQNLSRTGNNNNFEDDSYNDSHINTVQGAIQKHVSKNISRNFMNNSYQSFHMNVTKSNQQFGESQASEHNNSFNSSVKDSAMPETLKSSIITNSQSSSIDHLIQNTDRNIAYNHNNITYSPVNSQIYHARALEIATSNGQLSLEHTRRDSFGQIKGPDGRHVSKEEYLDMLRADISNNRHSHGYNESEKSSGGKEFTDRFAFNSDAEFDHNDSEKSTHSLYRQNDSTTNMPEFSHISEKQKLPRSNNFNSPNNLEYHNHNHEVSETTSDIDIGDDSGSSTDPESRITSNASSPHISNRRSNKIRKNKIIRIKKDSNSSSDEPEEPRGDESTSESIDNSESDHDVDKMLEAANPNYMMCLYVKVDKNKFKWRVKLKQGFLNIGKTEYAFDNAHGDLTWC